MDVVADALTEYAPVPALFFAATLKLYGVVADSPVMVAVVDAPLSNSAHVPEPAAAYRTV